MTLRPVYGRMPGSLRLPRQSPFFYVKQKLFSTVALVSPSVVLQLGSHHNPRPTTARKKTGVILRAMSMFRWLMLAIRLRVEHTPANTANYDQIIQTILRSTQVM